MAAKTEVPRKVDITPAPPKGFTVGIKLVLEVQRSIQATSIEEALTKAVALKIDDIIDFSASDIEHTDSQTPEVYGVYRTF